MQKHKLVKNIDDKTWKKFIAYCIINDKKAGEELTRILKKHIKGKLR